MDALDQQAFDLGWDFAAFGVNVPEDANMLFCDGYRAFGSEKNKTARVRDRYVSKWLQIRFGALRRGKHFAADVTPEYIRHITPASERCPVTERPFTFSQEEPTDWSVDRANNERGYVQGNILIISRAVNAAKGDRSLEEIRSLAAEDEPVDGLTPLEWERLAELIEPAFGADADDVSPVPLLFGQPVALGMPVSPLASFQACLSRALIAGWDVAKRDAMSRSVNEMRTFVCRTKNQRRAFERLANEVVRRSRGTPSYTEIWATKRIQRRLGEFIQTLDGAGLRRLADLQAESMGDQNTESSGAYFAMSTHAARR
jgi:hypothetical protein